MASGELVPTLSPENQRSLSSLKKKKVRTYRQALQNDRVTCSCCRYKSLPDLNLHLTSYKQNFIWQMRLSSQGGALVCVPQKGQALVQTEEQRPDHQPFFHQQRRRGPHGYGPANRQSWGGGPAPRALHHGWTCCQWRQPEASVHALALPWCLPTPASQDLAAALVFPPLYLPPSSCL